MANYAITQYAIEVSPADADALTMHLNSKWKDFKNVEIISHKKTSYGVYLCRESPWDQNTYFTQTIQDTFPTATIFYNVEETMSDILYTNDTEGRHFPNRYFLDSENGDEEYFTTIHQAAQYISQITGQSLTPNFNTLQEAIDQYSYDTDLFYSLHEIEVLEGK